jgi:ligand-binding sensor domain-containing protein
MTARIFFLLILCFAIDNAFPQSPYFRKHPLPLEYKNAAISVVVQDRNQFLWYGTTVGLVRFDGSTYKYFLQFSGNENSISCLYEDKQGAIWIGYKNGRIGTFANEKFQIPPALRESPATSVTGFAQDSDGNIWASTYGDGILIFQPDSVSSLTTTDGLGDNFVYDIVAGSDGSIFAGTDQGISRCRFVNGKKSVEVLSGERNIKDNIITSLATDSHGRLWVGSESMGIAFYDSSSNGFSYPVKEWKFGRITSMLPQAASVWVGTATDGLIEVDIRGRFLNSINQQDKALPLRVTDLAHDSEGNIWIASASSTVFSGHPLYTFIPKTPEKALGNIQAILHNGQNNIIFSTADGVYSISPHSHSPMPQRINIPEMKNAQVISLFEDYSGAIWMGTFDHGVYRYDPSSGKATHFSEKDGLVNNNVISIAGRDNEIWFATLGGVSQCVLPDKPGGKTEFRNYTSENGLGSNYIYKIFIDSKDRIWFATDGKGVSVLDKGKFSTYSVNEGFKSNIIYSVTEDSKGGIWASTSNAGIYRFNGSTFQAFNPHNGLRDLSITSIIGEKNGNILIVSPQGIDILDPNSGAVFYHGQEFGITDIDPNLNAYTFDDTENIWLGTQVGIIRYNTNIDPLRKWPVTRINEVQVFLSKIDTTRNELAHNQNHISFDYTGFWYHDPEEVSYKIKLQGYDREWVNSKNHFVTYPNLPPGDYTFMVQSSATNHFDGASMKMYRFSIASPFYRTTWFYILASVVLTGLAFWLVAAREKRLKSQERAEKEKIEFQFETLKNQVNPHFLFNSFNTLVGVIEEDKETAVEYVIKLSDFYRDILLNREKEVITLATEVELIKNYYFLQMKRYKENFRLILDIPNDKMSWNIPPLTLQLLVENAIKHNIISKDKPLEVRIFSEGDFLLVKNNLQPKVVHETSTGLGLNNIINRLKLLTGKSVKIDRTVTHFCVSIPLLNP